MRQEAEIQEPGIREPGPERTPVAAERPVTREPEGRPGPTVLPRPADSVSADGAREPAGWPELAAWCGSEAPLRRALAAKPGEQELVPVPLPQDKESAAARVTAREYLATWHRHPEKPGAEQEAAGQ